MSQPMKVLVTGAAGTTGNVGGMIVDQLLARNVPLRALVRRDDERAEALRRRGAEVIVADLTSLDDVHRAMEGISRVYFSLSVSPAYLEATANTAAVAKYHKVEAFVNMSQMTVSSMNILETTSSPQQKMHWLGEQILEWSGLPVVNVRPTVFMENPFFYTWSIPTVKNHNQLRMPFGKGHTSPVAVYDIARVFTEILVNPAPHIGKYYELTGGKSQTLEEVAKDYSAALGREIVYAPLDRDEWRRQILEQGVPSHTVEHLHTMAELHAAGKSYGQVTECVQQVTGKPPMTIEEWVHGHAAEFSQS